MTAPPLPTGSARTASRTCGAANCQPELTGVLRIFREWTRHRRQGKARRGSCALVAGGVTALEEYGKSGLGRFDNSRGEPCGDVETGRIRTRPHTARARCSRSKAALIPVLIIEADATSHAWQEVATVANWIIWRFSWPSWPPCSSLPPGRELPCVLTGSTWRSS